MPEQATVEQSDIEDLMALLREKGEPVPFDTLLERYVTLLKERVMERTETSTTTSG